jgi:hypothetical protein
MKNDHFAIVIGLSSYPTLGDPPPADLQGPENDADVIEGWLADPNGGGLPAQNIKKIRSRDVQSPPDAAPTPNDLEKAFLWLDQLAAMNRPRKVGTRLYLYVSGHGFSNRPGNGCLLTGNAAERQFSANISPSGWLDWLRDAAYFTEYVLWMDCCMDRVVLTQPTPPPLDPMGGNGIGQAFIAFAAARPLKASEKAIPEDSNRYHGVFTWNLIQGLRGAGADGYRIVNSGSLANWLREAQLGWLDDSDRANPSVAKEPAIIAQDPGIVFAAGVGPISFDVTLCIPTATAPSQIWLWSGELPTRGPPITLAAGGTKMPLKAGLYVAEGEGLRQGFAVTRSTVVNLVEKGSPVNASSGTFTLRVDPGDPSAAIRLCDNEFAVVMGGMARLVSPPLPFGLYLIRRTIGRQITEKVILLDTDWPPPEPVAAPPVAPTIGAPPPVPLDAPNTAGLPPVPPITSAAPLPGTRATREYHESMASDKRCDLSVGDGAELMVMARWFSGAGESPVEPPWRDVSVVDASGSVIADLATQGRRDSSRDPVAACAIRLNPGAYELRYPIGSSGLFTQSLIVPAGGWRMEGYILHTGAETSGRPSVSLLMGKIGEEPKADEEVQLQKAIVALADERPILNEQLVELLFGQTASPLARIVGAHLLLLSARTQSDADAAPKFDRLNGIVTELRNHVGTGHADVEALSLKCSDPTIRTVAPVGALPMFERSWELLLEGSQERPELISATLWQKVHATAEIPPYLVWTEDNSVQTALRKALVEAIFAQRLAPATAPLSPQGRLASVLESALKSVKSHTMEGFGKMSNELGGLFGRDLRTQLPQAQQPAPSAPAASGVSEQEIARRARILHLPPAALEILRQDVTARSAPAQVSAE